jgi:hypothetical protein
MARLSGAERGGSAGQAGEEGRLGMTGGEGQAHDSGGFDDASGDFEQRMVQARELGLGQIALFGRGVSDGDQLGELRDRVMRFVRLTDWRHTNRSPGDRTLACGPLSGSNTPDLAECLPQWWRSSIELLGDVEISSNAPLETVCS